MLGRVSSRVASRIGSEKRTLKSTKRSLPKRSSTCMQVVGRSEIETGVSSSGVYVVSSMPAMSVRSLHGSVRLRDSGANEWSNLPMEILAMPALSPSMTSGNIASWSKKEGDKISAGDVLAEVETDKATVAFEATEDGYLAKILVQGGAKNVDVSTPIAVVVPKKEMVPKFANYVHSSAAAQSNNAAASSSSSSSTSSAQSSSQSAPVSPAQAAPNVPFTVLPMPSLSPTMEEGVLASWKKKEGDKIKAGDVLAEIETDKATVAFEATEDGYLAKILVQAGATKVKVNDPVAIVVDKQSDIEAVKNYNPSAGHAAAPASPSSTPAATTTSTTTSSSSMASSSPSAAAEGGRVFASPYAKMLAKEKSFDLKDLSPGSGPNGRIVAQDVLSFTPVARTQQTASTTSKAASQQQSTSSSLDFTDLSVSNIRRVTAERLSQSKQTIPHYYLTMDCYIDELLKVRTELNGMGGGAYKLSVNDFVVKASALALRKVPEVNSEWRGDVIRRYANVDINVAVNTDAGLLTPIIRDADMQGLSQINEAVKVAAQKAKDNKLSLTDLQTGTFTISNLGMFGISNFCAVINPPQACILAVGAAEARVVPNTSASKESVPFIVKNVMTVTLSCDHRVVDGAVGAKWLQAFKDYIENPMKLLL